MLKNPSIFYQIQQIKRFKPQSVLEIGIQDSIRHFIDVKRYRSLDNNKEFDPDYLQDIRKLDIRERFDFVLCCEVLEHMPFEDVPSVLERLSKICDNLIISVPYSCLFFQVKSNFFNIILSIPFFFRDHKPGNQHHWELGRKNHSRSKFENIVKKHFRIIETYNKDYPYHMYYLLKPLVQS